MDNLYFGCEVTPSTHTRLSYIMTMNHDVICGFNGTDVTKGDLCSVTRFTLTRGQFDVDAPVLLLLVYFDWIIGRRNHQELS